MSSKITGLNKFIFAKVIDVIKFSNSVISALYCKNCLVQVVGVYLVWLVNGVYLLGQKIKLCLNLAINVYLIIFSLY